MDFVSLYDFMQLCLNLFSDLGERIINFMSYQFLGSPLIFWVLGAGLLTYLTAKLIISIITP